MKVKIINRMIIAELEKEVNNFLEKEEVEIVDTIYQVNSLHDLYYNGDINNQWREYTVIIYYEELTKEYKLS